MQIGLIYQYFVTATNVFLFKRNVEIKSIQTFASCCTVYQINKKVPGFNFFNKHVDIWPVVEVIRCCMDTTLFRLGASDSYLDYLSWQVVVV